MDDFFEGSVSGTVNHFVQEVSDVQPDVAAAATRQAKAFAGVSEIRFDASTAPLFPRPVFVADAVIFAVYGEWVAENVPCSVEVTFLARDEAGAEPIVLTAIIVVRLCEQVLAKILRAGGCAGTFSSSGSRSRCRRDPFPHNVAEPACCTTS